MHNMTKNDKAPRERAREIIEEYQSGSGCFSGISKPTFPGTDKPTYPATYGSTFGSNKVKGKSTSAEAARPKMVEKQQDLERDLKHMINTKRGLSAGTAHGKSRIDGGRYETKPSRAG